MSAISFVRPEIITNVREKLSSLEKQSEIKILFACESGSRAWGFPSPDSDYDVRFIYAKNRDFYLSLFESNDGIEQPLDGDLDISGWDIRKTLRLMSKSNAAPWEWLQSPIVYWQNGDFQTSLLDTVSSFYSMKAGFYHYISLCQRVHHESIPPMEFQSLRKSQRMDELLQKEISELLRLKL